MGIGFIVASRSRLGRSGSPGRAGRGAQALKVSVGGASPARPLRAHRWVRVPLRRRARRRAEPVAGGGLWREGEKGRGAAERELWLGDFQPAWLHTERPFRELRRGRGRAARPRPCPRRGKAPRCAPGAPGGLRGLLPPSCPLPAGLWGERKTHLITKIEKRISDNMGCNFAIVQNALKSLCAAEQ